MIEQKVMDAADVERARELADGIEVNDNNTSFLSQFLRGYDPTIYEVKRSLVTFMDLVSINTSSVNFGDTDYVYTATDGTASGRVLEPSMNIQDVPTANATIREFSIKMVPFISKYSYNFFEIARGLSSAKRGSTLQLDQARRKLAIEAHYRQMNQRVLFGNADGVTPGLLNHPLISTGAVPLAWANASKTGQQIVEDITTRIALIVGNSRGVHTPNTVAVSPQAMVQLQMKAFSASEAKSAFVWLNESYQGKLKFVVVPELAQAFGGGDGFVVYEQTPETIEYPMAQLPLEGAPSWDSIGTTIAISSGFGAGPAIRYPLAFAIGTGV